MLPVSEPSIARPRCLVTSEQHREVRAYSTALCGEGVHTRARQCLDGINSCVDLRVEKIVVVVFFTF